MSSHCNHGPHTKCINCLSKLPTENTNAQSTKWLCHCLKGQSCIHCIKKGPEYKTNFLPYGQYMENLKATCRYRHDPSKSCCFCLDPKLPFFKGKPNCSSGHRPWPAGVCSKCMPENAVLKQQQYRHVDGVSFQDVSALQSFIKQWAINPGLQRATILYGNVINEPLDSQNKYAKRAQIQALYQPPQEYLPNGVLFLKDPQLERVELVAKWCGLNPVGWAITTLPRGDSKKYGGDMILSGSEIREASRFQLKYSDNSDHSTFVTVIIKHNKEGSIEPYGYQVSDQCVALERDGLLSDSDDLGFLSTRKAKQQELLPTIIYKDKPLIGGSDFLPDEFVVTVPSMTPYHTKPLFRTNTWPSSGGTRAQLKKHLQSQSFTHPHLMLSDFNLLVFLFSVVGQEMTQRICNAIKTENSLPTQDSHILQQVLRGL